MHRKQQWLLLLDNSGKEQEANQVGGMMTGMMRKRTERKEKKVTRKKWGGDMCIINQSINRFSTKSWKILRRTAKKKLEA